MWIYIRAIGLLPFTVAVVIPAAIFLRVRRQQGSQVKRRFWLTRWVRLAFGFGLLTAGLWLVTTTVKLFAKVGKGTLAPWDPTEKLVVIGPYRHVRNPMISGVLFVLLGEATFFASLPVLYWASIFFLANAIYIPFSEEPGMKKRFGKDYLKYKENVSRWLPRLRPWNRQEKERDT